MLNGALSFRQKRQVPNRAGIMLDLSTMLRRILTSRVSWFLAMLSAAGAQAQLEPAQPLQFNRDIRPILSENCYYCHGQDPSHRKAKLRLDLAAEATKERNGFRAIVPGDPDNSELIARITSGHEDEIMPPVDSHKTLTPAQIALLRQWITEGAEYEPHWAFAAPKKSPLPPVSSTWNKQPWDAFVFRRLAKEGLTPAPAAAPETWLRRASYDLTGLAPTTPELQQFLDEVAVRGESAYKDAADRLLASPRYGERLAQDWLDAARYADTHGYNNDGARSMWRWRDWVIEAFNDNLPYNQFLTEQLAGDLLPKPTIEQRVATGFARNHVINSENAIIDEEYRVEYVADRVRTLGMSMLGLTLECARCHDHKFDPITQKDYFRLFAFFNQVPEAGEDGRLANAAPLAPAPTREQQQLIGRIEAMIAAADAKLGTPGVNTSAVPVATSISPPRGEIALPVESFVGADQHPVLGRLLNFDGSGGRAIPKGTVNSEKPWTFATWVRWEGGEAVIVSSMDLRGASNTPLYGNGIAVRITADARIETRISERWPGYSISNVSTESLSVGRWHHVAVTYDAASRSSSTVRVFIDGRESGVDVQRDGLVRFTTRAGGDIMLGDEAAPVPARLRGALADLRFYPDTLSPEVLAQWVEPALAQALRDSDIPSARSWLASWNHRQANADFARQWNEREAERSKLLALKREVPHVMVMADLPKPRQTFLLERGQYDAHGEAVEPGTPAILPPWPASAPRNRLGLAQWLTDPQHPLTARVAVNFQWQRLFGTGLVKTSDDFGSQGEYPIYPDLLDWLARDFVDSGWNVKALLRSIVLSATYRQDSRISAAAWEKDPENRLLARGPRVRLTAEEIRDNALAAGGLLRHRLGGPSVFPVQPVDLYKGIVIEHDWPGTRWVQSTGDDLYRRSLYTFWKRTVLHPSLSVFDAPDREFCAVRRSRTNTPLQALASLNEPTMLKAASALGYRMQTEGGPDEDARLRFGFRTVTSRMPTDKELTSLRNSLARYRVIFGKDTPPAPDFLQNPVSPWIPNETAAYAYVGSLLLNLDETVTKN
jgi:hypothetical protein